jgi:pimeloyl-ACP methyl ester carboxylesterase
MNNIHTHLDDPRRRADTGAASLFHHLIHGLAWTGLALQLACSSGAHVEATGASLPAVGSATESRFDVRGAPTPVVTQGRGPTVVLVHGALSDRRTWAPQMEQLASRGLRVVAYDQRYFGTSAWGSNWPAFGVRTHADDLAALIGQLGVGPVHVVGWSYSGQVVLDLALRHPHLVRSAFVYEPAHPTFVTDAQRQKAIGEDAARVFGPAAEASRSGDNATSAGSLLDAVAESDGFFAGLPAGARQVVLDNARTMPLLLAQPDAPISCDELRRIQAPVAVVSGGEVRPFFRLIADAAASCLAQPRRIVVPGAKHMWPGLAPDTFAATVADFVRQP